MKWKGGQGGTGPALTWKVSTAEDPAAEAAEASEASVAEVPEASEQVSAEAGAELVEVALGRDHSVVDRFDLLAVEATRLGEAQDDAPQGVGRAGLGDGV